MSQDNADTLDIIAKAMWVLSLDENSPSNESEACSFNVGGDFYSKWADNSSGMIFYKNGRMSSFGEVGLAFNNYIRSYNMSFHFSIPVSMDLFQLAFNTG